jgi:beta-glucosidase
LPLKKDLRTLYVTGPQANNGTVLLGNYYGMSKNLVNILEGITSRVSSGTTINYQMGVLEYQFNVNPIDWGTGPAKESEVTIAVLGISQLLEGEEGEALASPTKGDRLELDLPENQLDYLKRLKEDNDNPIIVVLTGGSPITMPEVEELADAVLWVWYPGQEGGYAVADAIFGDVVPSGKLPITFPVSVDQLPPYEDYSMKERTYRYMTSEPLYPFGYGLSYTDFRFSDLELDSERIAPKESLAVTVKVENAGELEAEEVVQLYVTVPNALGNQPRWSLKNFERVALKAGESRKLTFELDRDELEQFNEEGKARVEIGEYLVHVGNCSPGSRGKALGASVLTTTFLVK